MLSNAPVATAERSRISPTRWRSPLRRGTPLSRGARSRTATAARLTIADSTFSGNSGLPGGAIANYGVTATSRARATITNSSFAGNSAVVGGAIYNLMSGEGRGDQQHASPATQRREVRRCAAQRRRRDHPRELASSPATAVLGLSITDGGGNLDWPAYELSRRQRRPASGRARRQRRSDARRWP